MLKNFNFSNTYYKSNFLLISLSESFIAAIPSLHLSISDDSNANKNTELSDKIFTQSSLNKKNIKSHHTIFKQSSSTYNENPSLNRCYKNAVTQTEEHSCDIIHIRLNCLTKKFEENEESRKNLEIEFNELKAKYEAAITELNATNSEMIELKNNNNRLNSCLNELLTTCQIDVALYKKIT